MEKRSQFDVPNPYEVRQKLKEPGAVPDVDPFKPGESLPLHVQRMAVETQTVVTNLRKLGEFMSGTVYPTLPLLDRQLMSQQYQEMTEYAKTLSLRYCMALLAHG